MTGRARGWFALAMLASGAIYAQSLDLYRPGRPVKGAVRVWGSAQMLELVERWQRGFCRYHPDVHFDNHLYGAASAIAGLYTGVADLAVSREIWPIETLAFEQVLGYKPTAIEVATGSFDVPTKSDSLDIFVHRDNPISGLTLAQLGAVFGDRGKWGDLGLKGEWADKPVTVYGFKLDNAGMLLFNDIVMKASGRWNPGIRAFGNQSTPDGQRVDAGRQILDALCKDRYGIAISNLHYARSEVRVLPIAVRAGAPYVTPTTEAVRNRTYPLTRPVYLFLNCRPQRAIDPLHAEFVHYVLSREGQADVEAEGAYLPLPVELARKERSKLNAPVP